MATRGRKPGTLVRCTCDKCGAIELRPGCTSCFLCAACGTPPTAKRLAHFAVARAIRIGELKRPAEFACVDCGKPAEHYDHRDYSKPLEVQPVCRRCNFRRGPAA